MVISARVDTHHSKLTREGQARAKARGIKLGGPSKLTDQQRRETVKRLLEGESARAIARSLNVDPKTIRSHAKSMGMTVKQGARKSGSWQRSLSIHRIWQHADWYSDQAYWHHSKNALDAGVLDAELRAILRKEVLPEHVEIEFERVMKVVAGR